MATPPLDYAALLDEMRTAFGKKPRPIRPRDILRMPLWAFPEDPLAQIFWKQLTLLSRGEIVWGALVQVNELMFNFGRSNHPGNLIYCRDPDSFARPDILIDTAGTLYDTKGETVSEELRIFSESLANEMERLMRVRVPSELSQGLECVFTGVMFDRRHLPLGIVERRLYPLLVHPSLRETMILPVRYWPKAFLRGDSLLS